MLFINLVIITRMISKCKGFGWRNRRERKMEWKEGGLSVSEEQTSGILFIERRWNLKYLLICTNKVSQEISEKTSPHFRYSYESPTFKQAFCVPRLDLQL